MEKPWKFKNDGHPVTCLLSKQRWYSIILLIYSVWVFPYLIFLTISIILNKQYEGSLALIVSAED